MANEAGEQVDLFSVGLIGGLKYLSIPATAL